MICGVLRKIIQSKNGTSGTYTAVRNADSLLLIVCKPIVCVPYPIAMVQPIRKPANNSRRLRPRIILRDSSSTARAAAANRQPTKTLVNYNSEQTGLSGKFHPRSLLSESGQVVAAAKRKRVWINLQYSLHLAWF